MKKLEKIGFAIVVIGFILLVVSIGGFLGAVGFVQQGEFDVFAGKEKILYLKDVPKNAEISQFDFLVHRERARVIGVDVHEEHCLASYSGGTYDFNITNYGDVLKVIISIGYADAGRIKITNACDGSVIVEEGFTTNKPCAYGVEDRRVYNISTKECKTIRIRVIMYDSTYFCTADCAWGRHAFVATKIRFEYNKEGERSMPENVKIDVGNDGIVDDVLFEEKDLKKRERTINLANVLQSELKICKPDEENLCQIPVVFKSETTGKLQILEVNFIATIKGREIECYRAEECKGKSFKCDKIYCEPQVVWRCVDGQCVGTCQEGNLSCARDPWRVLCENTGGTYNPIIRKCDCPEKEFFDEKVGCIKKGIGGLPIPIHFSFGDIFSDHPIAFFALFLILVGVGIIIFSKRIKSNR